MENANPYAAPATLGSNQTVFREDALRLLGIAKAQHGLMLCVLGYLVSILFLFILGNKATGAVLIPALLLLVSSLGGLVFLVMLTYRLSGVVFAVIVGFCFLLPLVGFLLMLLMSSKASRLLKQAGFKIGLLGADINQVRLALESADQSTPA